MIHAIWVNFWELWEERNKDKHGHDLEESRRIQADRITEQIIDYYQLQELIPEELQWIFKQPIEDLLLKSDEIKAQWVYNKGPIIEKCMKELEEDEE